MFGLKTELWAKQACIHPQHPRGDVDQYFGRGTDFELKIRFLMGKLHCGFGGFEWKVTSFAIEPTASAISMSRKREHWSQPLHMSIPWSTGSPFSDVFASCLTSVLHSLQTKKAFPTAWHPRCRDKEIQVRSVLKGLADMQLEHKPQLLYGATPWQRGKSIRACKDRKTLLHVKAWLWTIQAAFCFRDGSNFTCPQQKKQMVREGWTDEWVNFKELNNFLKGMFAFYAGCTETTDNNTFTR